MTRFVYDSTMEKFVSLTDAKAQFSALVEDAVRGDDVVITKHGKPIAKIVKYEKPKVIFGLLEGKFPEWDHVDFDDNSHMSEAWADWRRNLEKLGE
jgi:prevent-host-death family protein